MARIAIVLCLLLAVVAATSKKKKLPAIAGRIIGGRDTDIKDVPYQVSLQFKGAHICGASIIARKYVLTAAHCVIEGRRSDYSVRAGSSEHATGGETRNVELITIHLSYSSATQEHDIAILKLDRPLTYSDKINEIPLADKEPKVGDSVLVSGWGQRVELTKAFSRYLQLVTISVTDRKTCEKIHRGKHLVNENVFCAGITSGGKGACQGDSGGPAIVKGQQAGIVSWGDGCGRKNSPGVYTNVFKHRDWILAEIRKP